MQSNELDIGQSIMDQQHQKCRESKQHQFRFMFKEQGFPTFKGLSDGIEKK